MPHGSRVRVVASVAPLRRCSNRTAVRLTTADQSGSKAGSEAPTCGSIALSADWSVWIPAAFSFRTAERGRLGQAGVLPDPGGDPEYRGLVRLQVHLGQLEDVTADPVADVVGEELVDGAHLDRDAEVAQLVLVALEHLLEGVVGLPGVALDHLADPLLGHVRARDQQADHQVEQPLTLPRRHPSTLRGRRSQSCLPRRQFRTSLRSPGRRRPRGDFQVCPAGALGSRCDSVA